MARPGAGYENELEAAGRNAATPRLGASQTLDLDPGVEPSEQLVLLRPIALGATTRVGRGQSHTTFAQSLRHGITGGP
jgi:hypothetical protein